MIYFINNYLEKDDDYLKNNITSRESKCGILGIIKL